MHTCIRDSALAMGTSFGGFQFRLSFRGPSNLLNKSLICFGCVSLFLLFLFFFSKRGEKWIFMVSRRLMEFCEHENF